MKITTGTLGLVLVLGASGAGQVPATEERTLPPIDESTKTAADDANAFALDLYARIAQREPANVFFSPTSISTALAMAYAGARGQTAEEMARALHFSLEGEALHHAVAGLARAIETERAGVKVSIANALWGQQGYPFNDEYLALGSEHYGAALREVDFRGATEQARTTINDWVESETAGKIRELFLPGSLDPAVRLVLTNAIYFKGVWMQEFDPKQTRKTPFHAAPGRTLQVDMMHAREGRFRYLETPELQALELPYSERAASMIVLLPARGRSLELLESELTAENLEGWLSAMTYADMDLVAIPRFEMTCRYSLPRELGAMGMQRAFTATADFSGIATVEGLYISEVVHKAFVEVNEEGTEAAAATGVGIRATSVRPPGPIFRADRPFVFLIRDEATGAILFLGRVTEP